MKNVFFWTENTLEKHLYFLQDTRIKQKIETKNEILFCLIASSPHLLSVPVPENAVEVTSFF